MYMHHSTCPTNVLTPCVDHASAVCPALRREEADDVSSKLSNELADSLLNIAMDQACLGRIGVAPATSVVREAVCWVDQYGSV